MSKKLEDLELLVRNVNLRLSANGYVIFTKKWNGKEVQIAHVHKDYKIGLLEPFLDSNGTTGFYVKKSYKMRP